MAKVRLIQKTVSRHNPDGSTFRQKSNTWYLDFGGGVLRSTGITDRKIAEQLRAREEARLVLSLMVCLSLATISDCSPTY